MVIGFRLYRHISGGDFCLITVVGR